MQQPKEPSIRKKLSYILGIGASRPTPIQQTSLEDLSNLEHSTFFTADVLRELDQSQLTQRRVRAMKENLEVVTMKRLEEHAVESIWMAIKDLIEPSQPTEVRHYALTFIRNLIYGQFEDLGVLRAHFMNMVQQHKVTEDALLRLNILCVLTQYGKNIHHMEESIGPFLRSWMPEMVTLGHSKVFLNLLINFVHYNAAYLDGEVLVGVVRTTCVLADRSQDSEILVLCLDFINAVVCYSSLPTQCLHDILTTLCQALNVEKLAKQCLEVMLKLLGTHLGRSAIYTMCTILEERSGSGESNAFLLRGAVFYVSMSMWGIRKVETLDITFASVLPSIKQAVLSHQTLVVFEAVLSLRRLVRTYSQDLHLLEWESIYDIMRGIQAHLCLLKQRTGEDVLSPRNTLGHRLRELFLAIEECYDGGRGVSIGEPEKFFDLVEENIDALPLKSILKLVSYRTSVINNGGIGLVDKVVKLMEKFYVQDKRSEVRIETLDYLAKLMDKVSSCYEDNLMESVVLRFLRGASKDSDVYVKFRAAQLLVQLLTRCSPKWSTPVLAIINSILRNGMTVAPKAKGDKTIGTLPLLDSNTVVCDLTLAFKDKLQSSSPVAAQILSMLVVLLQQYYDESYFFSMTSTMRINIFTCILRLRSNEYCQVGCLDDGTIIKFSPFFVCRQSGVCLGEQPVVITPMLLDYRSTFSAVLACLEKECEWEVLAEVLLLLRSLLQDRILTLSSLPDLSPLCQLLCNLIGGRQPRFRTLLTAANARSRADPSSLVFPVLTTLTTYPSHLDRMAQHSLVCCLKTGLVGKNAKLCVSSLSLCSLEIQATMVHLLPHILLRMSQVAATPAMALPVLEFLSNLIPIPVLYSGFVDQEYLSLFAISIPYTDHNKYSTYVIAMAHRVIAQWFVHCKMHYRPAVANFLCKKMAGNLEGAGCLSAQSSPVRSEGGVGLEMVEVCMDMLARYTYSNLSTLPSRTPGSDFLVAGGPTKTWIVGNSLVTITTSTIGEGLSRKSSLNGMGDRKDDVGMYSTGDVGCTYHGAAEFKGVCSCRSSGWAEIKIRRPSGNMGWMMHLQNKPHPLSLMHLSSYSSQDSEIGLLSASLPMEKMASIGGPLTVENEDIFLSREVGSFTDISFLSNFPTKFASINGKGESAVKEDGRRGATVSDGQQPAIEVEDGDSRKLEEGEPIPKMDAGLLEPDNFDFDNLCEREATSEKGNSCEGLGEEVAEGTVEIVETIGNVGEEEEQYIAVGLLSLEEAAVIVDKDDHGSELANDSINTDDSKSLSTLTLCPDHVASSTQTKRSSHSQSWSENAGTTPLLISPVPRASSYSFSMEHLPPLFSYDEGEEFGRSLPFHQGAVVMSEEEQLTLHASVNDLKDDEVSVECFSEELSTYMTEDEGEIGEDEGESGDDEEREDNGQEEKEEEMKKEDDALVEDSLSTQPYRHPRIINKSQSLPEQEHVSSTQNAMISPTVSKSQPSPLLSQQHSVPVTPPGGSISSISQKKLVFAQRPLSASGYSESGGGTSGHRREEDQFNNPSFIFLQLYNSRFLGDQSDVPVLVPPNETTDRAIKVLDHIPPYETHKIGVVYVKHGQTTELQILSNTFGSSRYLDFLRGLGPLMKLSDIPPDMFYLGGLDRSGTDGNFTYCYHDDITQVIYHVASMMPTDLQADPSCSNKKLHIGNDFVTIVYNDSGTEYKFGTIKGQFNYVEVVIEPLLEGVNQVSLHAKQGLDKMLLQTSPVCVSDSCLSLLVRQMALQANLASMAYASESAVGMGSALDFNLSNWLGRLHQINKIREKCRHEEQPAGSHNQSGSAHVNRTPRCLHCDVDRASSNNIALCNFTNYS